MKILMVIPTFDPIVGGAERQLQGIAPELAKLGHDVIIVTRRLRGTPTLEQHESGYAVRRLSTGGVKFGFHISLGLFLVSRATKYDLIHCHTLSGPALVCSLAGSALKKPVLLKITRSGQGSQIERLRSSLLKGVIKALWSQARVKFVAITKDSLSELLSFGVQRKSCVVIPNGVRPSVRAPKPEVAPLKIVYTGRLIPRKRVHLLLDAFSHACAENDSQLTIIGDGPLRKGLEERARGLGVHTRVTFTGELDQRRLSTYLSESDIFVLPSDSEGMSNSLLEAMACGLLVVAANIQANRELIRHNENGLLFDGADDLRSVLAASIRDSQLRSSLGRAAAQTITLGYSFEAIADRYAQCYRSLLGQPTLSQT